MINVETQYFSFCKRLLLYVGLWPYQQTIFAKLRYFFVFSVLISAIVFHITSFMTTELSVDLIIEVISSMCIFLVLVIKYNSFWLNNDTVKFILEEVQHVCNELTDKNEIAIVEEYGKIARRHTLGLTGFMAFGIIVFILAQSWSTILDIVLPRNESRTHRLLLPMKYLLDEDRYFYVILLYTILIIIVGAVAMVATGTVLLTCQRFFCGMLTVASYRIEHAMKIDLLENVRPNNKSMVSGITMAVDIHRKAMKLSELMLIKFEGMIAWLIVNGVIGLSLNMFRIFQNLSTGLNIEEILLPLSYASIIIFYMFLVTYIAQDLTDHNSRIFATVYHVQWYRAPLPVQKLILFLLQKGTKDFILIVGGIITGSLECFATLTNTSMSYFTVMYATQK